MDREYYNKLISEEISYLIEKKDNIAEEIGEIATYIDFQETNNDLCRLDINAINEKRNNVGAIYQLIEDLEKLRK